ncbi:MAG: TnpV protein [Defluviitaleaceae bacterium]|nr:TnpV protein [Defluviitaleaceae bacterium]
MKLTYTQVGDYLLPNIQLSESPDALPLGRYGMMHKSYLKEHKPVLYGQLLLSERLYPLCREVDDAAATRLRTIPDKEVAHEIILSELVYA